MPSFVQVASKLMTVSIPQESGSCGESYSVAVTIFFELHFLSLQGEIIFSYNGFLKYFK